MEYTPEQQADILERVAKAAELLKELNLYPDAYIQKVQIGPGTFADQVVPFLQDAKFSKKEEEAGQTSAETIGKTSDEASSNSKAN